MRPSKSRNKDVLHTTNGTLKPKKAIPELLAEAAALLQQSQPELALPLAEKAVRGLENRTTSSINPAAGICLLAEIQLELGDVDAARKNFTQAVNIDPVGSYIGADALLWLAQLCEDGGRKSIELFERANDILRKRINDLVNKIKHTAELQTELLYLKRKLSDALCSMAEIYMTDLSLEADAETKCESFVAEALLITPDSPAALQTLASVRISQLKTADAQAALRRSLGLWQDLPPDDATVPDFPIRISLVRLLMEVQMEVEAMEVLERLVAEDDQSVEAWYLGGWCQVLLAEKLVDDESGKLDKQGGAREWLRNCLRAYQVVEYEDDRVRDHAVELVTALDTDLGLEGDEEEWQDESSDCEEELEAIDGDGDAEMT